MTSLAYLARNSIELIVDHIEIKNQVIKLLDFEVKLGQRYLFAAPREVKLDVTMMLTPNENHLLARYQTRRHLARYTKTLLHNAHGCHSLDQ